MFEEFSHFQAQEPEQGQQAHQESSASRLHSPAGPLYKNNQKISKAYILQKTYF